MRIDANTEEHEVVAAVRRGHHLAFAELVRRHQRRSYGVCRAILANHEDAEDAVQEGFLNAYRAIDRFEPGQPFGAWLHRIMANAARDLWRRREVRHAERLPDSLPDAVGDFGDGISTSDAVKAGLATLSQRQRAVVVLHDLEGFTHAEIASTLGIPEGTAKSDLHLARRRMRAHLSRYRLEMF